MIDRTGSGVASTDFAGPKRDDYMELDSQETHNCNSIA